MKMVHLEKGLQKFMIIANSKLFLINSLKVIEKKLNFLEWIQILTIKLKLNLHFKHHKINLKADLLIK